MKSRITALLGAGMLVPLLFAGSVFALADQNTTTTPEQTTTETTAQADTESETLNETQKKELSTRIEKRKAEAKLRLTAVQQKRIQTRCKNAQGLVKKVSGRVKGIETNRTKVHTNMVERLKSLETKLAAKNVDTTQYKAQIAELETKIATFNTDMAAYKQAVSDLGNIEDCTADPTAFNASIEVTLEAIQKVHNDPVAIITYVKDTIKPTLAAIRVQLDGAKAVDTTEGTGAN